MKPVRLLLVAALSVFLAAAFMPGCGGAERVPEIKDSLIAQCTWTFNDYVKKADELALRAEKMQSPFREDAQWKIYLLTMKIEEGRAKLAQVRSADSHRLTALIGEMTAIMTDLGTLYSDAVSAVK